MHCAKRAAAVTKTYPELRSVLLQLVECSCSERVCANHGHLPTFPFPVVRKLGDGRCFACSLGIPQREPSVMGCNSRIRYMHHNVAVQATGGRSFGLFFRSV